MKGRWPGAGLQASTSGARHLAAAGTAQDANLAAPNQLSLQRSPAAAAAAHSTMAPRMANQAGSTWCTGCSRNPTSTVPVT